MTHVVRPAYRGPELLLDLVDHATEILVAELGVDEAAARRAAVQVACRLGDSWGGQFLWFPRARPHDQNREHDLNWFELADRDLRIYREFDGRNVPDICERYGISRARLYEIVAQVRIQARAQLARSRATTPVRAAPIPSTPDLFDAS